MQPLGESDDAIEVCDVTERCDVTADEAVFQSEEEMRECLSRLCYGDLYAIGLLWIQAMKTVLVGAKFSLIPVVDAADPEGPPKKPPKMRYKDLPIYESPHYDYKDHEAGKGSCPEAKTKLLHKALLPCVKSWRKRGQEAYCKAYCSVCCTYGNMSQSVATSKKDFKKYMRDPENLNVRQGVVAAGALTGYLIGGGGGIPRRTIFTSLGALAAGALCFPKETDEIFRDVSYHSAKTFLAFYNGLCKKNYALRERVPCKDELPPEPKPRKPVCPTK